jgi:hypothetical protein
MLGGGAAENLRDAGSAMRVSAQRAAWVRPVRGISADAARNLVIMAVVHSLGVLLVAA